MPSEKEATKKSGREEAAQYRRYGRDSRRKPWTRAKAKNRASDAQRKKAEELWLAVACLAQRARIHCACSCTVFGLAAAFCG